MSDLPFPRGTLQLSGSEIRRLRELREQVKVASVQLPMPLQRQLLELLEHSRPWKIPPRPVPEMTRGELIRSIRWRLGTIPLDGVTAAAQFVGQHRPRRRAVTSASASPSPPSRPFRRRRS